MPPAPFTSTPAPVGFNNVLQPPANSYNYATQPNAVTPYGTQAFGQNVNYNPFGNQAAPQLIGPTVYSSTFGSGSKSFNISGHYVGNPNGSGAVWVPG